MDLLSELSGRGFGLYDGGGCFEAETWKNKYERFESTIENMHSDICGSILMLKSGMGKVFILPPLELEQANNSS
jgi:hypothetical protein